MPNSVHGGPGKSFPSRCPPRKATTLPVSSHSGGRLTASPSPRPSDGPGLASRPAVGLRRIPTVSPPSSRGGSSPAAPRLVWGWSRQHQVRRPLRSRVGSEPATSIAAPPVDEHEALLVAAEHFAFCPDNTRQGPQALHARRVRTTAHRCSCLGVLVGLSHRDQTWNHRRIL
ncbi:DUF4253 domain-containing protein [Streptomyces sp. NPDC046866]|uniref:DUF4253 domain-containing protein n=1 Tax=Streptomyces sp. NPDC046866 TaxID=3154921 RepID=UPI00345733D5